MKLATSPRRAQLLNFVKFPFAAFSGTWTVRTCHRLIVNAKDGAPRKQFQCRAPSTVLSVFECLSSDVCMIDAESRGAMTS